MTKNYIVFWNSGKKLLQVSNVVADDPLRIQYSEDSKVLDVRILKTTRKVNKFELTRPGART